MKAKAGWIFLLGFATFLGYLAYLGVINDSYALAKAEYQEQAKAKAIAEKPIGRLVTTLCPTLDLPNQNLAYNEVKSLFIGLATKQSQPATDWLAKALHEAQAYSVVTIEIRTATEALWYIGINSKEEGLKQCLKGFADIITLLTGQRFELDASHFLETIPIGKAEKDVWTFSVRY